MADAKLTSAGDKTVVTCAAPYGVGGLGQHLSQVVHDVVARDQLECYFAFDVKNDDPFGHVVKMRWQHWILQNTPIRFRRAWQTYFGGVLFDKAIVAQLKPCGTFHTFSYHALSSFRRARALDYKSLVLESPTVHINCALRQQGRAVQACKVADGWASDALRRRALQEYDLADLIYVTSELTRQSFLAEGIASSKLVRRTLRANARFTPARRRSDDGVFRVVAVGSLSTLKGTPILLEAFRRFDLRTAELTLVGGWGARGMRKVVEWYMRCDLRIRLATGDPLPHLQRANVYVHASFTDGFGYAPMEALACGVPVVVTEDTGMKEHVQEGVNGYVVPTGSSEAILERLLTLAQRPLAGPAPARSSL